VLGACGRLGDDFYLVGSRDWAVGWRYRYRGIEADQVVLDAWVYGCLHLDMGKGQAFAIGHWRHRFPVFVGSSE